MDRGYLKLLKSYPYDMGYLLLHCFASSFGQTFFIALFVPQILSQFEMTNAKFGLLYSLATLISAVLYPLVGAYIDKISLQKFSLGTGFLMVLSFLVLSFSPSFFFLFIGIIGIRFSGQALMSHISSTTAARAFGIHRGKALGLTNFGIPFGEAILPPVFGWFLSQWSHRSGFLVLGIGIGIIFIPLSRFLYSRSTAICVTHSSHKGKSASRKVHRFDLLVDLRYMLLVPSIMAPPFILTGLILHQSSLGRLLDWPALWMTSWFFVYAIIKLLFSFGIGPLIDGFSAKAVYPYHLVPLGLGILSLSAWHSPLSCMTLLVGAGISLGMGSSLNAALLSEIYGIGNLGAIRSLTGMLIVISTAISPWIYGVLFDVGKGTILLVSSFLLIGLAILCFVIRMRIFPVRGNSSIEK